MSNNIIQINKHLDEFTKCYICLGKLVDATMCPNCQKLSCQKCIQKWIIERKSQCPHCRMSLKLNQIISVRFINELNSVIENLNLTKQKAKQEVCAAHNITLLYFCITCNESLCSDCFMFETKHKEHKIEKLENIYNSHCVLIKNESKELKSKCDKLNNYLKLLNEKIIFVRNYKTERSIELEEVFEKMKNKLESLMHEKLTKLINSKNMINDKLKFLDNIKGMIESELNEAPKSELISKSENIIRDLKEIDKEDEMKNDILNISLDLPSDIHPPYESGCFVIKDYTLMVIQFQSQVQNNNGFNANSNNNNVLNGFGCSNEVLYSEDLKTNGLIWRLKVYPFGNGAIKGEFVSVFLELRDGLAESSKYFYKIEIENFYKDSSNTLTQSTSMPNLIGKRTNFWKEFSSDFQNGECWGYNKFYRIEDLEKDGFIDETGKIVFRFYVRPQTYAQLCRDQKNYIKSLEKNNQILVNQINKNSSSSSTNKENFLVENFNNLKKNFDENLSSGMKQKHDDQMEKDDCEYNDSNKMQISNVDSKINSPGLNNKLNSNSGHSENNFDNNLNNKNNNNLIKIENEYLNNNDEENCKSENISPIITANNIKDKMEIDTEDTNPDISNNIFNTQIRLKKSQSVIVPNNKANASQNNFQNVDDSNAINRNNNFVLNENHINQLYAGNSGYNNFKDESTQEDNKIKEQKINAINTLTVNCDNIDEFNSDNFHAKPNTSINNNINKYSILNHICENNFNSNDNNNNIKEKVNDQQINQEELTLNSKKDNKVIFRLNKIDSDVIGNNSNSSAQGKNYNNYNTINNNEINESDHLKINKDLNLNYKSNQNKIMNALSNLNNINNNYNDNNNNTNLNNRYSKISNINTTNLNSNYASININYKNNKNNYIDHNQTSGMELNKNAHSNNNHINVSNSLNNFLKGKLLKNNNSINNNNDNNTLQNSHYSSENYNKQKAENQLIHLDSYSTEANDLALSNQNQKINNLRASADNIGSLSNRRETSNTSRNNSNLNNYYNNNKHPNFPKMEISTENKDDVRDEEHNFFLNYSEIKISKGLEEKQDTNNNNNLISQLKSENADVESEPIIITEINYKDLINKKVKNKLLKCEKLLNEIKVKDDSVKIINSNHNKSNNTNNLKSSNYSNTNLINKNKTNIPSSISNTNNVNLNASNNFNNFNCNSNSNQKAKNSIQNLQEQQQNIEKELFFNPLEINERNSNMNKNLILDISENLSQENNLNDSLGSLMESMKMMDDNSFYDQHILNLQKIKRAKDVFEDTTNPKSKAVKDSKIKNNVYKEDKSNREKNNDNFNLYPENQFFNNRHASPFLSSNHNNLVQSNNKRNVERNLKDPFGSEIFNEKLKRLISKKKK